MAPPTLLIVTQNFPPDLGGIQILMGGMAEEFARAGQRVVVFADRRTATPEPAASQGYETYRFGGPRPIRVLRKRLALWRFLRNHAVHGIVADSWKSVEALPRAIPALLVLAHGTEIPPSPSARKLRRLRAALARATAVVANSRYTADRLRPLMADLDCLLVVNPPIGAPVEPDMAARQAAAALIGAGNPMLLTIARLEPRKGIDLVIRALPSLLEEFPNLVHVVAGQGDDLPRLRALATTERVSDHVVFAGAVSEPVKAALMARADVFAMPARRDGASVEGFGIAYLEAALRGVPSLAGREGGAPDAVLDHETGLLCDPYDASSVRAALHSLLSSPALRRRLGDAAAARVRQSFLWPSVAGRYLSALSRAS
jgi:phosphatidylinositol alpha-1,6-mannosyltransferase